MHNKVFLVYFCFVGKMGNFHSYLVKYVGSQENFLNLMMFVGNSIFVKIIDFACLFGGDELFVVD